MRLEKAQMLEVEGRHAGVVHADPAARGGSRLRQRVRPAPQAQTRPAVRQAVRALPGLLPAAAVLEELRAAPRLVVRAEPSRTRTSPRRSPSGSRPTATGGRATPTGRRCGSSSTWTSSCARSLASTTPSSRSRRRVEPLDRLRTTLRRHYAKKREHYGLEYPNFYDRDLRRLFSDAEEHRPQNEGVALHAVGADATCAGWSPSGRARISTRSTASSRT